MSKPEKNLSTLITREDLERKRTEAFDRWTWDTGSEEDKEEFETCDLTLKILKEQEEAVKEMLENMGP